MMPLRLVSVICLLIVFGCTSATEMNLVTPSATIAPICGVWDVSDAQITCISVDENTLLIQSGLEQVTLRAYEASIVFIGTILVEHNDNLHISVLEGDAIISARGQIRVLIAGRDVRLSIIEHIAQAPSAIGYALRFPDNLPLNDLSREIDIINLILTATPHPTGTPSPMPTDDACQVNQAWTSIYIVEAGDTLERIARRYDLSTEALAEGNCIDDVSRIILGQEIFLPATELPATEISEPTPAFSIGFRADAYAINLGDCTILRWDALGVHSIYLDEDPVNPNSLREICPDETTSYSLRVVLADATEQIRELTISVRE